MKLFKRLTAMTLAMVMIVTMLSVGLTSQASITHTKITPTVSITVPELIYLTPGANTFQYYIAGAANGSTPSTTKNTSGSYSFSCSHTTSSIQVSVTGGETTISVDNGSGKLLTGSMTSGSMSSSTEDGLLTWTFTYVIDGLTFTSVAYTYVYAPYLGQTGCQHNYTYYPGWLGGNQPRLNAYAFIMGIHSVNGGSYTSAFVGTESMGENRYFMSPLVPGWNGAANTGNVPTGDYENNCSLSSTEMYFPDAANSSGGISNRTSYDRDTSKSVTYGSASAYGVLTIDSSRYAGSPYNVIPNFAAGWMIFAGKRISEKHKLSSFVAKDSQNNAVISFADDVSFSTIDDMGAALGQGFAPYPSQDTIMTSSKDLTVEALFSIRRSGGSTVDMTDIFGLHIIIVDKSVLRTAVNNAISAAYQAEDFESADFTAFNNALKTAATVLGNPAASESDITAANGALATAVQKLNTEGGKSYTATVLHKLPAADGFKYTYNGTEYTAADGYITITETQSFPSSADVTVSSETFTGYTITPSSETYTRRRSDITKTYIYSPKTSKIYFDYKDTHVIGLSEFETERTVTYGQPYGTLPSPTMDGWAFGGWYESGTSNRILASTLCTMIDGTLYLQAKWTCYFAGGYGTANEPFLISTMANLDKIDDATAYQINNGDKGTKDKYYKQTADFSYNNNSAPVLEFGGTYEGDGKTITIPSSITVSSSAYGCVFGAVSGATVRNLNVVVQGGFAFTGASGSSGFFGTLTNSNVDNIHITFNGTTKGVSSGVLANTANGSTITNCSVDVQSGTVAGDAFIGSVSGGTRTNNWVLLSAATDSAKSDTANGTVRVRENTTAAMTYTNGRYTFTATPNSGWSAQFREADDTLVINGATYSPTIAETGKAYYVCAVKDMTFQAGTHGTLTGAGSYKLRQGQTVTGLTPVPDTGYSFSGWSTGTANGTMGSTSPYTYTMNTIGGTVTANFGANHYSVEFNKGNVPGNVTLPATQTYSFEDKVTFPSSSVPSYSGWQFLGWYSQAGGKGTKYELNTPYDALSTTNNETVTIYAYWTQAQYTVRFETNGGTAITPVPKMYGETLTFPTSTYLGYKDLLWYTDAEFTSGGYQPGTDTQIYSDITFYAKWIPITYTIAFNASGATNVPPEQLVSYNSGEFIIPSTYVPVKEGYVFAGWDTVMDGSGTRYNVTEAIPGNLSTTDGFVYNLYAQWTRAHFNVTWVLGSTVVSGETVPAKINGSTVNPVTEVIFGDRYLLPEGDITLDTKAFKGWYTAAVGGTPVTNSTTVAITADTNFYAQWEDAKYFVKYDGNGGTGEILPVTVTYGEHTFTFAENAFTRDGYSFIGWNTAADGSGISYQPGMSLMDDLTVVNGDEIIFYAQWRGNTFKITYNVGGIGGSLLATNGVVMDGNPVTLRTRTTATKDGSTYIFGGWAYAADDGLEPKKAYDSGASFQLTEDVLKKCDYNLTTNQITLYAIWLRQNTVTWNLLGGKMADGTTESFTTVVTRGDKYVLPASDPTRSRFVFIGWFTAAEVGTGSAITNDTVLNANTDQNVYARWISNGNLTASYTTEYYYETYTAGVYPETPASVVPAQGEIDTNVDITQTIMANVPTGFTVDEVNSVLSGTISEDEGENADPLVLKVYYSRKHYSVSFNANSGSGSMTAADYAYDESRELPLCTMEKEGYSFDGWNTNSAAATASYKDGNSFKMGDGNVTLYAIWKINQYKLTINNGYGGNISTKDYDYNAPVDQPAVPVREGYTFGGWDKEIPDTMPANDLTITAEWQVNQYTLTFSNGYDGIISVETLDYGTPINAPAPPVRDGFSFTGWDKAVPATMPAYDLTITAIWSNNLFTLTFANGYGGNISSENYAFNAPISAPAENPTREGYTFTGWDQDIPATMPANNLLITAVWQVNQYTLTFTNGYGSTISSESVNFGTELTEPDDPVREGYTFKSWSPAVPATMPARDLTIAATWTVNKYLLKFVSYGDNVITSATVPYGDPIEEPSAPTREGYTYRGWDNPIPATMPANDLTITAVWQINQYRLTFTNGYGGTIFSEDVNFGTPITAPAEPTRDGYSFKNWSPAVPETMPARDLTIEATWTTVLYTLTFANGYNDGVIFSERYAFNAPISAPSENPTREGYTFRGWNQEIPATMPANDLTITAVWEANRYRLTITDGFGGELLKEDIVYGTAIPAQQDPVRTGYTFKGWSTAIPETMPARNLTIDATWTVHTYTVIFAANGGEGTMASQQFTYDVEQALTANAFTKTGCMFAGWSVPGSETLLSNRAVVKNLVSGNGETITLTAEWDNIIYTISFELDGGEADPELEVISTIYSNVETLPDGTGLTYEMDGESRTFLGWKLDDDTFYAGGSTFTMPAQSVVLTAVWSANYYALDALIATIDRYQQTNALPATQAKDPRYAAGGDFASLLNSNGSYPWSSFDTTALDAALADAKDSSHRGLPQSEQATVDGLKTTLQNALNNVALLNVNYDLTYRCTHNRQSYYDSSSRKYYPACETGTKHSYNSVLALIDGLLEATDADSLYTADSLTALRQAVYGGGDRNGIVQDVQRAALKLPAQSYLETYVDQLADAYHTLPALKDADYSQIDYLMNTYLPQEKHVTTENMLTYYTTQSVQSLLQYYNSIDRTYKITRQSVLVQNGRIYNELKQYIDNLVARPADFSSVYTQILRIPKGENFSYPSGSVNDTEAWTAWTSANAGNISQAIDKEYLDTRYEANTVAVLNDVLDRINWNLDIFSQNTVNGESDVTYEKRLRSAIDALVRRTYSATFMMNDGTNVVYTTTLGHYYGDAIHFPVSNPTRDGYLFLGWSSSASEYIPVTASDSITGNMVYYATWDLNAATIAFNLNGVDGTTPETLTAEVGKEVTLPSVGAYAPEGETFVGWSTDPNAKTGVMAFTLTEKANVVLYAIWAPLGVELIAKEGSSAVIDKERGFIYGLTFKITENVLLSTYLDVEGNGTLEVMSNTYIGTGTKVNLVNNYTGEIEAVYTIVIFGDVDGDGAVTTDDIRTLKGHLTGAGEFKAGSAQAFAADVDGDGYVSLQDGATMKGLITGAYEMDQATRRAIK